MDQRLRQGLLIHVVTQCSYAIAEAESVADAVQRGEIDGVFRHTQSMLGACANVSKVFWPARGRAGSKVDRSSRAALRKNVELDEESALANRTIRDHLEHMDERIEDWATKGSGGVWHDANVGSGQTLGATSRGHVDGYFRHFDLDRGAVRFGEDEVEIGRLLVEVHRVWVVAAGILGLPYVGPETWRGAAVHSARIGMSTAKPSFYADYAQRLREQWGLCNRQ